MKTKSYNTKKRLSVQAKAEIQRILDTHNYYKNCFTWGFGGNASVRQFQENKFRVMNPDVRFTTKDGFIDVRQKLTISGKRHQYRAIIVVNGAVKNILAVKGLLK
jgi:hypothetical protein